MIPEIGLTLLIAASCLSLILSIITIVGIKTDSDYLTSYSKPLIYLIFIALLSSIISLAYSFLTDDFSVAYVANHSNTELASLYKVAAVWGSHEGSMLFWVFAISAWAALIYTKKTAQRGRFHQQMMAILALVILGFSLFLLFTSNPFARLLPEFPIQGRDLNPILQDIGLIIHPPLLFLGYVGLTICFAGAVSALLCGGLTQEYAKHLRPWAIMAWVFLTGGNAFGSWWAYNELGWGGWWFWDPVENASFIPWLVATAMMHSITMTCRRGIFGSTTIFLCILAFSLSLLGSFLVRSGVVQSVHAFASDPTRGMSILVLLILFAGSAMALFASKTSQQTIKVDFTLRSKETLLLLGNLLLVTAALSVLLGTCYPLMFEVLTGSTISVGAPYFNSIFIPIAALIFLLMGFAPLQAWQNTTSSIRSQLLLLALCIAVALVITLVSQPSFNLWLFIGCFSALWIVTATGLAIKNRSSRNKDHTEEKHSNRRFYAMCIAHVGVALSVLGATYVSNFEQEELLRMGPGQGKTLAGYTFVYEETQAVESSSYTAIQAQIRVLDADEEFVTYIYPQRQTFKSNAMELSAAGIHSSILGDLYISMGQQLKSGDALSDNEYLIRIGYKPFVSWIWIGAIFMMFSGIILVMTPRRATSNAAEQVRALQRSEAIQ